MCHCLSLESGKVIQFAIYFFGQVNGRPQHWLTNCTECPCEATLTVAESVHFFSLQILANISPTTDKREIQ